MRAKTDTPETEFKTMKNIRRWVGYSAAIGLMFGYQTNSGCDGNWQAAYLHYIKTARQLSTKSENILYTHFLMMSRARVCVVGLETINDENGESQQLLTYARFENSQQRSADAMWMMCMMRWLMRQPIKSHGDNGVKGESCGALVSGCHDGTNPLGLVLY